MTNSRDTMVFSEELNGYAASNWSWITINSKSDLEVGSDIVTQEAWNYLRKLTTARVWITALDKFIDTDALVPNIKFRACEMRMKRNLALNIDGLTKSKESMCETLANVGALSQYKKTIFEILIEARLK
jgi:hypothetical protein